jgi:hypothetical protein
MQDKAGDELFVIPYTAALEEIRSIEESKLTIDPTSPPISPIPP